MESPTDRLRDILYKGVVPDIYLGERARELHRAIGRNADRANGAGVGEFCGAVQNAAVAELNLSVTKLFERPSRRFPTRSIPAAIALLRDDSADLSVVEPEAGLSDLTRLGVDTSTLLGKRGAAYVEALAGALAAVCPDPSKAGTCELSRALDALRERRNKAVAHNEASEPEDLPAVTWAEAERLLGFAKNTLGALGITFFGTAFTMDDGTFAMAVDTQVAGIQFERLLTMAGILDSKRGTPLSR